MKPRDTAGRHRADARILAALAAGLSLEQSAISAGVSRSTVARRLRESDFREELAALRSTSIEVAGLALAASCMRAAGGLLAVLDDLEAGASARVAAARALLEYANRFRTDQPAAVESAGDNVVPIEVRIGDLHRKLLEFRAAQTAPDS